MAITKKDIEHVARLARLRLEQPEKFEKDLSEILEYVERLNEVNTEGVSLDLEGIKPVNQLRADEPRLAKNQELILEQAPKRSDNYFETKEVFGD